jgi:palmitoyltransferase ZDHHC9/14/18
MFGSSKCRCALQFGMPAGQSGAAIALMIFTFIFFWFVCGLSGFHTWLVATNQTTYENFR